MTEVSSSNVNCTWINLKSSVNKMIKINFYTLLICCMMLHYSYTCSSDQIRDIMINSCNTIRSTSLLESKVFLLLDSFDYSLCCDTTDPNIVNICARYFCH
jgi:hypothetical protein